MTSTTLQPKASWRRIASVAAWTLACLAAADLVIGTLLYSPRFASPRTRDLARYFEYGASIEYKLDKALGDRPTRSPQVIKAGWLNPEEWRTLPNKATQKRGKYVTVYGQSFAFNATSEMLKIRPDVTLRLIGGPGAPPSHSHAALMLDSELRGKPDAIVIGVLASSISKMPHGSMLASSFESPSPYTYPVYRKQPDGSLAAAQPLLVTPDAFIRAFRERSSTWSDFIAQVKSRAPEIDDFIMDASPLDNSMVVRLLRRGWVNSRTAETPVNSTLGAPPEAFTEQIPLVHDLLKDIVKRSLARGEQPIIVLFNDRGYDRALDQSLQRQLSDEGASVINTEDLFSSKDPRNFVPDGHYSRGANAKIATAIAKTLR